MLTEQLCELQLHIKKRGNKYKDQEVHHLHVSRCQG